MKGRAALEARASEDSVPVLRAERHLRLRGVLIPLGTLSERSVAECIDAISWANNVRPLSVRPPWIAELLQAGKATLQPGICSSCGLADVEPWANPARTLCVACQPPMPPFVERVLASLHGRGLGARTEAVDERRAYVYARHPYGPEASVTIEAISDAWAKTDSGSIVHPSDVVDRLLAQLRKRGPS